MIKSDLRSALRILSRNRLSTIIIVGLLALALGVLTITFTIFDVVLLRPLPVDEPGRLIRVAQLLPKLGLQSNFPYPYYEVLHERAQTMAVFGETARSIRLALTNPLPAAQITVLGVTPDFFSRLRIKALYGRLLTPEDDNQLIDGTIPLVVNYPFWKQRLAGNPTIIGRARLTINNRLFTIVGVLPEGFNGPVADVAPDARIPLRRFAEVAQVPQDRLTVAIYGRLIDHAKVSQAQAEAVSLWQSTMKDYFSVVLKQPPANVAALLKRGAEVQSIRRGISVIRERYSSALTIVMGAALLLLLLVCSNVAGLLLARAASRQHELVVRIAIGATPRRLVRHVIAESFWLGLAGAAGGLCLALLILPVAIRELPRIRARDASLLNIALDTRLNWRVFCFLLFISILTILVFSIGPALVSVRINVTDILRSARASKGIRGRQVLVGTQIALCTVFIALAGLFSRSYLALQNVNPRV